MREIDIRDSVCVCVCVCVCMFTELNVKYGAEDVDIAQPTEMTVRSAPPKEVYQCLFLRKMR